MRHLLPTTVAFALFLAACGQEQAPAPAATTPTPEPAATAEPENDPVTGLKMAENWEIVRANCTACHSAKLITQQRGTSGHWLKLIRWMQATQNLWQFDPDTEAKIVGYLADNYPPSASQRRAALPPDQMPPNPYAVTGGL